MVNTRILLFLVGAILVPAATVVVILFARGYRVDLQQKRLRPTGLLAATSVPEGAQVYLDGQLKSATNTTLNLPAGTYEVQIKKIGFQSWKKTLAIDPEVVTRTATVLFPSVPSLKAVSSDGAANPMLSPDGSKVVFTSTSKEYLLDLTESPLGLISRDPKLIEEVPWSTPSAELIKQREEERFKLLPEILQQILATSAAGLVWSPRENKVLYTATASASIPENLIKQLPGSNTQPQSRQIYPNVTYVYDLEEDRNFKIDPVALREQISNFKLRWMPDSNHLLYVDKNKIHIVEYDGTNDTVIYAGPMADQTAIPYPSGKQILILTNLSPATSKVNNLYAVSLR